MKRPFPFVCSILLTVCAVVAHPGFAETFLFSSNAFAANGNITAVPDPTTPGAYDVTSITGTVYGLTITGLLPCASYNPSSDCTSSGSGFAYDNVLYYPSPTTFPDGSSIGFLLSNGLEATFYTVSTHNIPYFMTNALHDNGTPIDLTISPVPEPASCLLAAIGLGTLAAIAARRPRNGAGSVAHPQLWVPHS